MKTTSKHFEIFKSECEKWIEIMGLLGHRFYFMHNDDNNDALAWCVYPDNHEDRAFTLGLTKTLRKDRINDFSLLDIKRSAFHEVMEAFLYRIRNLSMCRFISPEEVDDEVHNIIRTLENVLYPKYVK